MKKIPCCCNDEILFAELMDEESYNDECFHESPIELNPPNLGDRQSMVTLLGGGIELVHPYGPIIFSQSYGYIISARPLQDGVAITLDNDYFQITISMITLILENASTTGHYGLSQIKVFVFDRIFDVPDRKLLYSSSANILAPGVGGRKDFTWNLHELTVRNNSFIMIQFLGVGDLMLKPAPNSSNYASLIVSHGEMTLIPFG